MTLDFLLMIARQELEAHLAEKMIKVSFVVAYSWSNQKYTKYVIGLNSYFSWFGYISESILLSSALSFSSWFYFTTLQVLVKNIEVSEFMKTAVANPLSFNSKNVFDLFIALTPKVN